MPTAGSTSDAGWSRARSWAISSISIPPCAVATTMMRSLFRSSTKPMYSSRSIGTAASMYNRCTTCPSGPVWWVTSRLPSSSVAALRTSSSVLQSLMPPALPRAPEWIWAFTAQRVAADLGGAIHRLLRRCRRPRPAARRRRSRRAAPSPDTRECPRMPPVGAPRRARAWLVLRSSTAWRHGAPGATPAREGGSDPPTLSYRRRHTQDQRFVPIARSISTTFCAMRALAASIILPSSCAAPFPSRAACSSATRIRFGPVDLRLRAA